MISIYLLLDLEFHQYVTMSVIWKMHMILVNNHYLYCVEKAADIISW